MYSVIPDSDPVSWCANRDCRIRSACASSRASRRTTRSKVCPGSSIVAARLPSASGIGCRSSSSVSSPRASTRRFAGSIVTSATDFPDRAARAARAALMVVLPTPPVPTVTMTGRSSNSSIALGCCSIGFTNAGGVVSTGGLRSTAMSARERMPPGCSRVSRRGTGSSSSSRATFATFASWRARIPGPNG